MSNQSFLPLGTPIQIENLALADEPAIMGRVVSHEPQNMMVLLPPGHSFRGRTPVRAHAQTPEGLYSFETYVSDPRQVAGHHLRLASPQDMTISQRRAHARLNIRLLTTLLSQDGKEVLDVDGRTLDLGMGGVSLVASRAVIGPVSVRIRVPRTGRLHEAADFQARGAVRRCTALDDGTYQLGIAFMQLSHENELFLAGYLRRKLRLVLRAEG